MAYSKQAFYNTAGNIAYLAAQWLLTVVTTRMGGVGEAGILSYAISVGNLFFFVQMYGMRSYQVSDAGGQYAPRQYVRSRYVTVVAGLVSCAIFVAFSESGMEKGTAALLFLLYRSAEAISDAYFGELQKVGRLDILAKSMTAKGIVTVMVFSLALYLTGSLPVALFSIVPPAFFITLLYDRRRYMAFVQGARRGGLMRGVKGLLGDCFLLMVSTILPVVVTSYPRIVLDRLYGSELLGHYGNVSTPTVLIIAIVPNVLVPVMTLYGIWARSGEYGRLVRGFLLSIAGTVAFGGICMLGVLVLGDYVMAFVFTDAILPYVHYLYPLVAVMTVYAMTMCGNSLLVSVRRNRAVLLFSAAATTICCIACNIWVPAYGIWGAVLAMGLSYVVQFVGQALYIAVFAADRWGRA